MTFRMTPLADALPASVPFVGPETQERARNAPFMARLGANESVFGPSPKASAAMAASDPWQYGDPENHDLRSALAAHLDLKPDHIVVGEGIDGLLGYLVRLFVGPGDAVVTSDGAYPTFNYHVAGFGGTLHKVPYKADREDLGALLKRAAETHAKLVYFANPDNPMGTWYDAAEVEAHLEQIPSGTVLVLDEAYIETAPKGTAPQIDPNDPRVIRMRTFSKAYGLAGARVGYAIGHPELVSAFNKVRNHFGVNRMAQAGALAALADQTYVTDVIAKIAGARDDIAAIARANGLIPLPSATNFVTIDCGQDGPYAKAVLDALLNAGIFVRMPFVAPGNRCIRISCGTREDLRNVEKVLPDALREANIP